ncbi:hypothetical protein BI323_15570 [Yersinia ruckeri]|nr:hypothetical protein BI323_15570 [Yersinia ruckeri]
MSLSVEPFSACQFFGLATVFITGLMAGVIDDTGVADGVVLLPLGSAVDSVAWRDALNGLRGPGDTGEDDFVGVDLLSVLASRAGLNAAVQCAIETLCVGQFINATN